MQIDQINITISERTVDTRATSSSECATTQFHIILSNREESFLGQVRGNPINRNVNILYSFAGCGLFIAASALNITCFRSGNKYTNEVRDYGIAKASIAIINGAVFLAEAIYSWRDMH